MNNALGLLSEGSDVIKRLQGLGEAKDQLADPDYWSTVGIISLTGILVVFIILAILIFFFWLMGTIFKAAGKKKAEKKEAAPVPEKPAAPVVQEAAVEEEPDNDEEIVAVISAAVAAYAEAEGANYTIRSIKKHRDTRARSAWNIAGISGNMQKF